MGSWFSSSDCKENQPQPDAHQSRESSSRRHEGLVYDEMERLATMTKETRVRGPRAGLKR